MAMDIQTLRENLKIGHDGKTTIVADTVSTAKFASFYGSIFDNQPLTISNASPGPDDGGNTVQRVGTASLFRRVDNAPVTATFVLDPQSGDVSVRLMFTLIGAGQNWKFSDSFPDLPVSFDFSSSVTDPQTSALDDLALTSAWFYALTDAIAVDIDLGTSTVPVSLDAGLGFAGIVELKGILLALESLLDVHDSFAIGGNIIEPTVQVPPLRDSVNNFPWIEHKSPPGISLFTDLGLELSISDKLALTQTIFSIYSPLSAQWWTANPSYEPFMAISGALTIPSAGLTIELSSKIPKGTRKLVITGEFSGFSLNNLADLLDLAGIATLIDYLPKSLQDALHDAGKMQLLDAAIALTGSATGLSTDYVYLTVGIPDAQWKLLDDEFLLESISVEFYVTTPFATPAPGASIDASFLIGKAAQVHVSAGYPDFFIAGELEDSVTLPLQALVTQYLPAIQPPTDLTIDKLSVNIDAQAGYNFYTEMAKSPGWVIPLGPHSLTIEDIQFGLSKGTGSSGKTSAQFAGGLVFDESLTLAMSYDPTQGLALRGALPQVTLNGLIGWLCNAEDILPSGLGDLPFTDSTLLITKTEDQFKLSFGTQVANAGSLAFELLDQQGTWGFALGLDLSLCKLSALPGLSSIQAFLDIFPISGEQVVIISTLKKSDFTFPALDLFQNPQIKSKQITIPAWSGGLQKGFYFYAQTQLNQNKTLQNLAKMLSISQDTSLDAGVFIGTDAGTNARLFANISTVINQSVMLSGALGVQMQAEEVEFYLTATARTTIESQSVRFDVSLAVVENGAFVSGDMVVEGGKSTIDFSVFKLKALAFELGISFEGEPSIGFAAELDIADIDSSLAVFIDTVQPSQSMVAGAISNLSLAKVFDELTGAVASDLPGFLRDVLTRIAVGGLHSFDSDWQAYHDALNHYDLAKIREMFAAGGINLPTDSGQIQLIVNTPDQEWYLLDLSMMYHYEMQRNGQQISVSLEAQLYVVPQQVSIATLTFPQGFHIFSDIQFLLIREQIKVEVMPNKGIGFNVEMAPIVIGNDKLFKLTGAQGLGGPSVLLCTFSDANNPEPHYRVPAFRISGEAYLLGIGPQIDIDIQTDRCHFEIKDTTFGGSTFNLQADINGIDSINAQGSASVGIDQSIGLGPLGTLTIDDTINAALDFGCTKQEIFANASFSFTVASSTHDIAAFDLDINVGPLGNLPGILLDKIKQFFVGLFQDTKKWLEYVYQGILKGIEGIEQIGRVLRDTFKLAWKQAAIVLQAVGYVAEDVEKMLIAVFNKTAEEAQEIVDFLYNTIKNCAIKSGLLAAA
ncbi:hypothetical protein EXW72_04440 [Pseudomonas sp. BCA14]|uniref:hypothetical protein n=1 Tax=unclassified Pseudomonas TaxID=196821 RepID=UPI00106F029A|nr:MULTISPECIES: hypothetical protein [unclassified Pseudomonas]TFF14446.1 hypothetical protein EXW70_08045 [Pseudomonas sp. JMN1]TFF14870.1 hypothetical protein EXW71_00995 [Pseudomonas sp. BCA17]TFF31276.1 hypothetical protein EXW72_04440 [Pseudomonas sp. BCA14]TFF32230.1 hypothetical protein EXW73_00245 [Pseudomonas sp. BCA13]